MITSRSPVFPCVVIPHDQILMPKNLSNWFATQKPTIALCAFGVDKNSILASIKVLSGRQPKTLAEVVIPRNALPSEIRIEQADLNLLIKNCTDVEILLGSLLVESVCDQWALSVSEVLYDPYSFRIHLFLLQSSWAGEEVKKSTKNIEYALGMPILVP